MKPEKLIYPTGVPGFIWFFLFPKRKSEQAIERAKYKITSFENMGVTKNSKLKP